MRFRTAALSVSVLGLLASGCSTSEAGPRSLPTLTSAPTPTRSPVVVPAEAKVHTAFGAVAFVRFYFAQVNRAFTEADPGALTGLSDPECGTCRNYAATASKFAVDGQRIRGMAVRVISAEGPPEENGYIAVDTHLDAPAREITRRDGALVEKLAADPRYHVTVYVKRVPDGWVVRAVKALK